MRNLIAVAFAISSTLAVPGIMVTSANAQASCGADASPEHLRPGGYCDQINAGKSLTGPNNEGCNSLQYVMPAKFRGADAGVRIHLALDCTIRCGDFGGASFQYLEPGDRLHVAQNFPSECAQ